MNQSNINNVAACLCAAKARASRPDAKVTITGDNMNHEISIELPDGRAWTIKSVWEWWKVRPQLRRGL